MPVERNIGSTLVDTKPIIKATAPVETRSPADAKEFSLDTVEAVGSKGPYGQKCIGPCVQRCLPPPPPPKCR